MVRIKSFNFNPFEERTFVVWDITKEAMIIDPGCYDDREISQILTFVKHEALQVKAILLTHGHFDHIFGVSQLLLHYPEIPVYMSKQDENILLDATDMSAKFALKSPLITFKTKDLKEGNLIKFGHTEFTVIETPGHTPGSLCFYCEKEKVLFSGDTLFAGSIGRTDFYLGNYDDLILSIMNKLMNLDGDIKVYPGHGPSTDIGYERINNPFLQPFNELDEGINL